MLFFALRCCVFQQLNSKKFNKANITKFALRSERCDECTQIQIQHTVDLTLVISEIALNSRFDTPCVFVNKTQKTDINVVGPCHLHTFPVFMVARSSMYHNYHPNQQNQKSWHCFLWTYQDWLRLSFSYCTIISTFFKGHRIFLAYRLNKPLFVPLDHTIIALSRYLNPLLKFLLRCLVRITT